MITMLKLLIADDDPFTLQGIISAIPWRDIGIGTIYQASNGSKAYQIALQERPQLLLTDVRMPKMDGIELASAYRQLEPSAEIVFMSGFSDKEYLKSAIKIRAVSYVEKPIDTEELQSALQLAVAQCRELLRNPEAESKKIAAAVPLISSELALAITKPQANAERMTELSELAGFSFPGRMRLQTLLIKIRNKTIAKSDSSEAMMDYVFRLAAGLLTEPNTTGFAAVKDQSHFVVHLYDSSGRSDVLQDAVDRFASNFLDTLPDRDMVFIASGKPVIGLKNAEESYRSATITLQHMFFNGYPFYSYSENQSPAYTYNAGISTVFTQHLAKLDIPQAVKLIHSLTFDIKQHKNTMVNSVKEIYFQLLLILVTQAGERDIQLFDRADNNLWNKMSEFHTLSELRDFLEEMIQHYARSIKEQSPYSAVVDGILTYIHQHYDDENLSIGQISTHTLLTASYLCNRFKQETGLTINQYLTEYRVSKAKELLRDTTLKVADVSLRVGYSNGDYFAKCFRKITGKNPSAFREDLGG
ncbi:helix-turn-helix domain-containing protein [Paenibacillus sp. GCM10023252]|uniref:response regulator transcription factor n=1 Tax=Paenibacillus sp. GCM10023252 TaxID=3252649 RepID=UPI003620E637